MPPEPTSPIHLEFCPVCGVSFKPFLRGQVVRHPLNSPLEWLKAWWNHRPFASSALICWSCKEIVGYENPYRREENPWLDGIDEEVDCG